MAARHVVWKRRVGQLFRIITKPHACSVVLNYHPAESGPASLPLSRLQEQVARLVQNACVVTIDELLASEHAFVLHKS